MYIFNKHWYYVYIVTNPEKAILYIGVTNNLEQRLNEHYSNKGNPKTFAGEYYCYNLIYYEEFQYVRDAIARVGKSSMRFHCGFHNCLSRITKR